MDEKIYVTEEGLQDFEKSLDITWARFQAFRVLSLDAENK